MINCVWILGIVLYCKYSIFMKSNELLKFVTLFSFKGGMIISHKLLSKQSIQKEQNTKNITRNIMQHLSLFVKRQMDFG